MKTRPHNKARSPAGAASTVIKLNSEACIAVPIAKVENGHTPKNRWLFRVLTFASFCLLTSSVMSMNNRGSQFIPITSFSAFLKSTGSNQHEQVLTSPRITTDLSFDELVVSWNVEMSTNDHLKIEVCAVYPDRTTKYYTMGLWSTEPSVHPRESVLGQRDDDGNVKTDTLILKQPCNALQLRLTCADSQSAQAMKLKFVGVSLLNSKTAPSALSPNRAAWGTTLPVIERSQMAYPNGGVLCSPTTVSMMMTYWAKKLERSEMDQDVPAIVKLIHDPNWEGTGNWPFNTAYAGSYPGMRAYVGRLTDVSELEDWIAAGVPVGLSVCYNKLRGRSGPPSGHLVVCVGFTEEGDAIINDPGTSKNVRKVFPRKQLINGWAHSRNTVYFIYPETIKVPEDRFGHWDSAATRLPPYTTK